MMVSTVAPTHGSELYNAARRVWNLNQRVLLCKVIYVELGTFRPPMGADEGMFSTGATEACLQMYITKLKSEEREMV